MNTNANTEIFNTILDATKGMSGDNLTKVLESLAPQALWLSPEDKVNAFKKILERMPELDTDENKAKILSVLKETAALSTKEV